MRKQIHVIVLLILITLVYGAVIKPHNALAAGNDINLTDNFSTSSASMNLEDYSSNYIKISGDSAVTHDNQVFWNNPGVPAVYLLNTPAITTSEKSVSFVTTTQQPVSGSEVVEAYFNLDSSTTINDGYVFQVTINDNVYAEGALIRVHNSFSDGYLANDESASVPVSASYLISFKQSADNKYSMLINGQTIFSGVNDSGNANSRTTGYIMFGGLESIFGQANFNSSSVPIGSINPFCSTLDLVCWLKNIFIPNPQYDSALFANVQSNINTHVPFAYVNAALNLDFSQTNAATSSVAMTIPMLDSTASTSGQMYHPRILGVATTAIHWEMPATTKHNIALFSYPIFIILFVIFFIDFIVICVHIMLK